jgi:hypothetical protein
MLGCRPQLRGDKYYCSEHHDYYTMNDSCRAGLFGGYTYNNRVNDKDISDAKKLIEKSSSSSPCWITTCVVNILGYSDDCYYLTQLRSLRNNVFQADKQYWYLLAQYDNIGPVIADKLIHEKRPVDFAQVIEGKFLLPLSRLIDTGDFKNAISIYMLMTNYLQTRYQIPDDYYFNPNDYDFKSIKECGHGKVKIKNR